MFCNPASPRDHGLNPTDGSGMAFVRKSHAMENRLARKNSARGYYGRLRGLDGFFRSVFFANGFLEVKFLTFFFEAGLSCAGFDFNSFLNVFSPSAKFFIMPGNLLAPNSKNTSTTIKSISIHPSLITAPLSCHVPVHAVRLRCFLE